MKKVYSPLNSKKRNISATLLYFPFPPEVVIVLSPFLDTIDMDKQTPGRTLLYITVRRLACTPAAFLTPKIPSAACSAGERLISNLS